MYSDTLVNVYKCQDILIQHERKVRQSIPIDIADDIEMNSLLHLQISSALLGTQDITSPLPSDTTVITTHSTADNIDNKQAKVMVSATEGKVFYSKRRKEELAKQGIIVQTQNDINSTTRTANEGLKYDVRGIRKHYKPGAEVGRPKSWKPSSHSVSLTPDMTEYILLRVSDKDYSDIHAIEERRKKNAGSIEKEEDTYKNRIKCHRKATVTNIQREAPRVGYTLKTYNETMDGICQRLPLRTNACQSPILRSSPIQHTALNHTTTGKLECKDRRGICTLQQYANTNVKKAEEREQTSRLLSKEGEILARKIMRWEYRDMHS